MAPRGVSLEYDLKNDDVRAGLNTLVLCGRRDREVRENAHCRCLLLALKGHASTYPTLQREVSTSFTKEGAPWRGVSRYVFIHA